MKKTFKGLLATVMAAAIVTASGSLVLNEVNEVEVREGEVSLYYSGTSSKTTSSKTTSSKATSSSKTSSTASAQVEITKMYVTGIEKNITIKDSDDGKGKVLAQLKLKDEVEVIDDSSETCYYAYYKTKNVYGYITKEYLTEEKNAVCKRQDAYTSKQTSIYSTNGEKPTEIEKLKKNSPIYIVSKNSGDYWYVYDKTGKTFGYVKSMDISTSKTQDTTSTASKAQTQNSTAQAQPQTQSTGSYYTGTGSTPSNYSTYYAKVNTGYLAIRTAKAYDDSNIIGQMYTGYKVYVIDKSTGTYWYCYSPDNGVYGYVNSNYLVSSNPGSGNNYQASTGYTTWTVGGTNSAGGHYLALRTAPSYNSANEIGKLYDGQTVQVYSNSYASYYDTYWYVYAPSLGKWGYVNSNYIWS